MKLEPIAKTSSSDRESLEQDFETLNVIERVRANQQKLTADLKRHYECQHRPIGLLCRTQRLLSRNLKDIDL